MRRLGGGGNKSKTESEEGEEEEWKLQKRKRGRERRLQEGRRCTQALDIDTAPPLLVVDLV